MLNGIIIVNKEVGYTSRDAVSRLTGILRQRRIGHTGTLDPAARGVLPMCVGSATKLCELLTADKKEYKAVMKLGFLTDTEDTTGAVTEKTDFDEEWYRTNITKEKVESVLQAFVGKIEQIPPMYSAKKIQGKRLYELARQGKIVERKPAIIQIYKLTLDEIDIEKREISIAVECSKGTYIRTLCKDIGETLGTKASMAQLLRTKTGIFTLEKSYLLDELETLMREGKIDEAIIPVEELLKDFHEFRLCSHNSILLDNGATFSYAAISKFCSKQEKPQNGEQFRMYNELGIFRAIYSYHSDQDSLKVYKMF